MTFPKAGRWFLTSRCLPTSPATISRVSKRATQYAYYTPEFMVRALWRALRSMGFDGGRVLEPGCGTGLFFALAPKQLSGKLSLTGVEMDATTARIAKLLYPTARVRH
jgi:type I restriction-modification system DNA methylase subunit